MSLHGKHLVAGTPHDSCKTPFHAVSPLDQTALEPAYPEGSEEVVDVALLAAEDAFNSYSSRTAQDRAAFLEAIASEILALGDTLLERAHRETGLPLDRLTGERGRTVGQLRLFAELLREGSWCDARIDTALPDRQPLPRPDLRRILSALGPVAVFGASNFPLAFSVAGGDTASALAAGCPVVAKAHPAHPGTSELVGGAIAAAAASCGMPAGIFSLIHGRTAAPGLALLRHPLCRAVGFTGSHQGGRALLNAANARPEPIPVFAEMSSLNPVFVLPGALRERGAQIAGGLKNSTTMGVGQFCTKPGLVLVQKGPELAGFLQELAAAFTGASPATMLHAGICEAYHQGLAALSAVTGVRCLASVEGDVAKTLGSPAILATDSTTFLREQTLHAELFGPCTLLVECTDAADMARVAASLEGQLTATLHTAADEVAGAAPLLALLQRKAGRVLFNGFPTGVEVCPAMQHGGPYPATTDARFTSVGTAAIQRWARPVCLQNAPHSVLPPELQDANPRGLMRLVNGKLTRDAVA